MPARSAEAYCAKAIPSDFFLEMISLEVAYKLIDESVRPLEPRKVRLSDAVGRVIAEKVVSPLNIPQFESSSMDGIACRYDDLKGNGPWRLKIQAVIAAGDRHKSGLQNDSAAKIMTGAPLPDGADTVIPVEEIKFESDAVIIENRPARGGFVRGAGDNIRAGARLYRGGETLSPADIGILSSIGLAEIAAIPIPRISIISTGRELAEPGQNLRGGQIYDSNRILIESMLKRDNMWLSEDAGTVGDDRGEISRIISEFCHNSNLVICSGGVSMGDFDLVPSIVAELGEIIFHKVSIKPGKPLLLARIDDSWFLGLPGNPVSVLVGYHIFARRLIARLTGRSDTPVRHRAVLATDLEIRGSRFSIIGARLEEIDDSVIAHPVANQKSWRLSDFKGIDGLLFIEGGDKTVPKGSKIYFERL